MRQLCASPLPVPLSVYVQPIIILNPNKQHPPSTLVLGPPTLTPDCLLPGAHPTTSPPSYSLTCRHPLAISAQWEVKFPIPAPLGGKTLWVIRSPAFLGGV